MKWLKKIFLLPVYIYKYIISPLTPPSCRHYPTCSSYAISAVERHGIIKGGKIATNRIARCQPWGTSGYDPVPLFLFKKLKTQKFPSSDLLKEREKHEGAKE